MSKFNQNPLEALLKNTLDKLPESIRESMINIAALTWFNLETLQVTATEYLPEGKTEEVLNEILSLGLSQPFQGLGYSYHEEIQRILLRYLAEQLDRTISVYQRSIDYLHHQIELTTDSRRNMLKRELANRLVDLGQAYILKEDLSSAKIVYFEAVEIFRELDYILEIENSLTELGEAYVNSYEWENADLIYKTLLGPKTFNDFPLGEVIQRKVADYFFKKAEWSTGREKWPEAVSAYTNAKKLYDLKGDLASVYKIIKILEELSRIVEKSSIPSSSSIEKESYVPSSEPNEESIDQENMDEVGVELEAIESRMRAAWIPKETTE